MLEFGYSGIARKTNKINCHVKRRLCVICSICWLKPIDEAPLTISTSGGGGGMLFYNELCTVHSSLFSFRMNTKMYHQILVPRVPNRVFTCNTAQLLQLTPTDPVSATSNSICQQQTTKCLPKPNPKKVQGRAKGCVLAFPLVCACRLYTDACQSGVFAGSMMNGACSVAVPDGCRTINLRRVELCSGLWRMFTSDVATNSPPAAAVVQYHCTITVVVRYHYTITVVAQ
jgi:hypothetical protein